MTSGGSFRARGSTFRAAAVPAPMSTTAFGLRLGDGAPRVDSEEGVPSVVT